MLISASNWLLVSSLTDLVGVCSYRFAWTSRNRERSCGHEENINSFLILV